MKILFPVETFYPSQAGGAANSVYWLAKSLKKQGLETTVVATDKWLNDDTPLNKWIENEAGRVIFVRTRFLHFPIYQLLIAFSALRKTEIVHLSSIFFPTAFLLAFASRILGKKVAWSPRGELTESALSHSKYRKRPILWLIRKFFSKGTTFHSTSDAETHRIREIFGEKVKIVQVPNYVELPAECRREAEKYLLFLGRIHPIKGLDNLIEALALSKRFNESEFDLVVAGRGKPEMESKMRNLVSLRKLNGKIRFVGHVEKEKKERLLSNAYFTIMPSLSENFGMVVLESLSQNTPVIASRGTPWEALEDEGLGFWVENTPEKLRAVIDRILNFDEHQYAAYRNRGRSFVKENFDINHNISKWVSFYEEVAKK